MLNNIKASHIFNTLALGVLLITILMFSIYKNTKEEIINASYQENLIYVHNLSKNIEHDITKKLNKDFYNTLFKYTFARTYINSTLQLFVTNKYKYIYLIDKKDLNKDSFRFLADGETNKNDKSEFAESFLPLNTEKFNQVYKTKKSTYFIHKDIGNIWTTYLYPIIIAGKIEAIIVIDFSLAEQKKIQSTLNNLDNMFFIASIFFIIIFLLIIWFSYIDKKREHQKNEAFEMLKNLNTTLEDRVQEEVNLNRIKDKQLMQQSRLAQMGEMLSMIAHQWRQPLSAISSVAVSLNIKAELGKADEETVIGFAKKISEYAQHLSSTIDDFRDFFKPSKEVEYTTFNEIIASVLKIVENEINLYDINLIQQLECYEEFYSYPNELKQVILNLLKNAQDILVEKNIQDPYIKVNTYTEKGKLVLTVSDNGGGIPEDIIDKVFDPYFSTKLDKNGTGIGLYMSKTIVDDHCKGELSVSNNEEGAVFKLSLESL